MKTKLITIFAAVVTLFSASIASAYSDREGAYLSGTGALSFHNDTELKNSNSPVFQNSDHNIGGAGTVAIGYMMGQWRAEIEGAYRRNNIGEIKFNDGIGPVLVDQTASLKKSYTRDIALMVISSTIFL